DRRRRLSRLIQRSSTSRSASCCCGSPRDGGKRQSVGAILILGRPEDRCCQLVQKRLCSAGRDVWFLPEDTLLPDLRFSRAPLSGGISQRIQPGERESEEREAKSLQSACLKNGVIEYRGRRQRFTDIDGVLCRFYGIPIQPEDYGTPNGQYVSAEWNALLMA